MTLVAIGLYGDYADVVTDTHMSTNWGRSVGYGSKVQLLPRYDAVLASQGVHRLAVDLAEALIDEPAEDFDILVTRLPDHARRVAGRPFFAHLSNDAATPPSIYIVGLSPSERVFRAFALDAPTFELLELHADNAPFINPAPARLCPEPDLPTSDDDWATLAYKAHLERSMDLFQTGRKTSFGGQLVRTRLHPGSIWSQVIHEFPTSGAAFHEQRSGFLHPSSQLGACPFCRSGKPFVECCLDDPLEEPCRCGSGTAFEACCRVDPASDTEGPCPCGRDRLLQDCCAPIPGGWAGEILAQAPEIVALFETWYVETLEPLIVDRDDTDWIAGALMSWYESVLRTHLPDHAERGIDTGVFGLMLLRLLTAKVDELLDVGTPPSP